MAAFVSDENFVNQTTESVLASLKRSVNDQPTNLTFRIPFDELFAVNAEIIVRETLMTVIIGDRDAASAWITENDDLIMARTGQVHATDGIHPAVGLASAEMLFDVALPILINAFERRPNSGFSGVQISRALHHATWRRFPPGAVAYVEHLMNQLSTAHEEGRKFLSRELHDRVAHDVAAALVRVETATIALDREQGELNVQEILKATTIILRDTLNRVQDLAVAARHVVGHRGLASSLVRLARDDANTTLPLKVTLHDNPKTLASSVSEEGLTIVQEAIRNARRHAKGASTVLVDVHWPVGGALVIIRDDGRGFDPTKVRSDSLGLAGMRERAEAIAASFNITSSVNGTQISLFLPADNPLGRIRQQ